MTIPSSESSFDLRAVRRQARLLAETIADLQVTQDRLQAELFSADIRMAGPAHAPQEFEVLWGLKTLEDINAAIAGCRKLGLIDVLKLIVLAERNGYVVVHPPVKQPAQPEPTPTKTPTQVFRQAAGIEVVATPRAQPVYRDAFEPPLIS